jgi:hypothetical protein
MAKAIDNQEKTEKENRIKGKNGGSRPGAGRPPFVPTDDERKQVEALSGYGLPQDQIAILIRGGIGLDTLREHFATELVSGKAKANGQVGKTLFQKAMGGDTAAMIWWSKAQMRWAETQKHEHTGTDGAPIEIKKIERVIVDQSAQSKKD